MKFQKTIGAVVLTVAAGIGTLAWPSPKKELYLCGRVESPIQFINSEPERMVRVSVDLYGCSAGKDLGNNSAELDSEWYNTPGVPHNANMWLRTGPTFPNLQPGDIMDFALEKGFEGTSSQEGQNQKYWVGNYSVGRLQTYFKR